MSPVNNSSSDSEECYSFQLVKQWKLTNPFHCSKYLFVVAHKLINRTANDLGLSIIDFVGGNAFFGNHDIAYLRGVHMKPGEFTGDRSPYKLKPNEKNKSIPELGWYIIHLLRVQFLTDALSYISYHT